MKKIKMLIYGEAGVGKSVFASGFPSPYFICSDGNYEWLDKPMEDHIEPSSYEEFKNIVLDLKSEKYDKYQTIVIDLLEDFYDMSINEFCKDKEIDYVGDLAFGKGYKMTTSEFFSTIKELIKVDKHIVIIAHQSLVTYKDVRGVEKTKYQPTSTIRDVLLDAISGRLRYVCRAFFKTEKDNNGNLRKKRYLSLVAKQNEFGVTRGNDEDDLPDEIALNPSDLLKIVYKDQWQDVFKTEPKVKVVEVKPEVKAEPEPVKVEEIKVVDLILQQLKEEPKQEATSEEKVQVVEEVKVSEEPKKELSQKEKLEALKQKVARMKQQQK